MVGLTVTIGATVGAAIEKFGEACGESSTGSTGEAIGESGESGERGSTTIEVSEGATVGATNGKIGEACGESSKGSSTVTPTLEMVVGDIGAGENASLAMNVDTKTAEKSFMILKRIVL